MHPRSTPTRLPRWGPRGWLRCSSLKYSRYSRSSRLAIGAPRPSRCDGRHSPRAARGFAWRNWNVRSCAPTSATSRPASWSVERRECCERWFGCEDVVDRRLLSQSHRETEAGGRRVGTAHAREREDRWEKRPGPQRSHIEHRPVPACQLQFASARVSRGWRCPRIVQDS